MREVVLQIPTFETEQNIEIDVKVNGKKRTLSYRVELISFEDDSVSSEETVDVIKRVIANHEKDWKLIRIGAPTKEGVSIIFQKRKIIYEDIDF